MPADDPHKYESDRKLVSWCRVHLVDDQELNVELRAEYPMAADPQEVIGVALQVLGDALQSLQKVADRSDRMRLVPDEH